MKKKKAIAKIMLKCIIVKLIIIIKKKKKDSKGRALVSINSPRDNPIWRHFTKHFFKLQV